MRMFLVSNFLPEVTQQIHSLRARGVISFHTESAFGTERRALCKSVGISCNTSVISLFYQILSNIASRLLKGFLATKLQTCGKIKNMSKTSVGIIVVILFIGGFLLLNKFMNNAR